MLSSIPLLKQYVPQNTVECDHLRTVHLLFFGRVGERLLNGLDNAPQFQLAHHDVCSSDTGVRQPVATHTFYKRQFFLNVLYVYLIDSSGAGKYV